eukprot:TRINITY_DN8394_c0_g1_i1.p1 TRINITY_DN8394_c0_g1~~TRINITY_DN8394_c0_g1_i1.p1  ORF type:complete len:249 (-),score=55.79 TRINITY_DN8394_c0_g1_i1:131-877(-)
MEWGQEDDRDLMQRGSPGLGGNIRQDISGSPMPHRRDSEERLYDEDRRGSPLENNGESHSKELGNSGPRHHMEDNQEDSANLSLFVGNLDPNVQITDLEALFEKWGVIRVDLKTGYAFVFLESGHRAAIEETDQTQFMDRRLKVELAKGDGSVKRREEERRSDAQRRPCDTLFVVNFHPSHTITRELEKLFGSYGKLIRVEVKRNFGFIQYDNLDDAIQAKKSLDGSKMADGRQITVEYVARTSTTDR